MHKVSETLRQALIDVQLGRIDSAEVAVKCVRESVDVSRSAETTVELMVIEGACRMYAGRLNEALDRFRRASTLADTFGGDRHKALARCWLSTISLNLGRHLDAAKIVVGSVSLDAVECPLVRFRYACLVAMLSEYVEDRASSVRWFQIARGEAARAGEPRLLSPLLYNVAMLRIGNKVAAAFAMSSLDSFVEDELDMLMLHSSKNYDALNRVSLQLDLHDLVLAFAEASSRRFKEALVILERLSQSHGDLAAENVARAEFCRFWCRFELGLEDRDINDLLAIAKSLTDADDIAFACRLCSRIAEARSDFSSAQSWRAESDFAMRRLHDCKQEIRLLLDNVTTLGAG